MIERRAERDSVHSRRTRRFPPARYASVVLAALGALGVVAPACGSDTESKPEPNGAADASLDHEMTTHMDGSNPDASASTDGSKPREADGSPGDGGAEPSPELVAFCQKYASAVCDEQIACGFSNLPPRAECVSLTNDACLHAVRTIVPALRSGRLVYDASKVDACIFDATDRFCTSNNFGSGVPSCQTVFRGTVSVGRTCYAPYFPLLVDSFHVRECVPEAYCDASTYACPGTCTAYAKNGDACTTTANHCAPGTYCDGSRCRTFLGAGESCAAVGAECDPSLTCGPTDSGAVCETPKAPGEPCRADAECDHLYCLTGTCRPGRVGEECAAFRKCDFGLKCGDSGCVQPIPVGGACSTTYDACADGLVCEVLGHDDAGLPIGACHSPRTPTAGQPCFNGTCASGFWCKDAGSGTGTCEASGKAGDPCSTGTAGTCASGLVCNGATTKCQAPSGAGGACDPDSAGTCEPGFACAPQKTCAAKANAGEPCSFRAQCPENYDCAGTCIFGKLPGATCVAGDLCIGGTCATPKNTCNGDCVDPG